MSDENNVNPSFLFLTTPTKTPTPTKTRVAATARPTSTPTRTRNPVATATPSRTPNAPTVTSTTSVSSVTPTRTPTLTRTSTPTTTTPTASAITIGPVFNASFSNNNTPFRFREAIPAGVLPGSNFVHRYILSSPSNGVVRIEIDSGQFPNTFELYDGVNLIQVLPQIVGFAAFNIPKTQPFIQVVVRQGFVPPNVGLNFYGFAARLMSFNQPTQTPSVTPTRNPAPTPTASTNSRPEYLCIRNSGLPEVDGEYVKSITGDRYAQITTAAAHGFLQHFIVKSFAAGGSAFDVWTLARINRDGRTHTPWFVRPSNFSVFGEYTYWPGASAASGVDTPLPVSAINIKPFANIGSCGLNPTQPVVTRTPTKTPTPTPTQTRRRSSASLTSLKTLVAASTDVTNIEPTPTPSPTQFDYDNIDVDSLLGGSEDELTPQSTGSVTVPLDLYEPFWTGFENAPSLGESSVNPTDGEFIKYYIDNSDDSLKMYPKNALIRFSVANQSINGGYINAEGCTSLQTLVLENNKLVSLVEPKPFFADPWFNLILYLGVNKKLFEAF